MQHLLIVTYTIQSPLKTFMWASVKGVLLYPDALSALHPFPSLLLREIHIQLVGSGIRVISSSKPICFIHS